MVSSIKNPHLGWIGLEKKFQKDPPYKRGWTFLGSSKSQTWQKTAAIMGLCGNKVFVFFIKCHYKIYVYCIKAQKWTNFHFFLISKCKSIINGLFINENTRVMKKSYISFKKKIFWYLYTIFEIFTKFLMYKMFFLLNSFNIEQIMALWIMKKISMIFF